MVGSSPYWTWQLRQLSELYIKEFITGNCILAEVRYLEFIFMEKQIKEKLFIQMMLVIVWIFGLENLLHG